MDANFLSPCVGGVKHSFSCKSCEFQLSQIRATEWRQTFFRKLQVALGRGSGGGGDGTLVRLANGKDVSLAFVSLQ